MKTQSKKTKKIRKGDKVIAIAGNDRGRVGTVLNCVGEKAIVQGLNMRKKHMRKSQLHPRGNIASIEKPIHLSNLKVCIDDQPIKLKTHADKKGQRQLIYKQDGKDVVYRPINKPVS